MSLRSTALAKLKGGSFDVVIVGGGINGAVSAAVLAGRGANVALVDEIEAVASAKSCTPSQVALAWVLGRGEHVMTIPGTTKLENLKDNLGAYAVRLSSEEQATLDQLADRVMGDRYDEQGMAIIDA